MKHFQKGYTIIEMMIVIMIPLMITFFAAWINHVITCIQNEAWVFLVAGAIFFPIGIIHGIGLWFGAF